MKDYFSLFLKYSTDPLLHETRPMKNLFQIGKMLLRKPMRDLPDSTESALIRATICWFEPEYAADVSARQTLIFILKNMRRRLVAEQIRRMEPWIEKSGIRRLRPELPEYRVRRNAVRALLAAFRHADSIRDFRKAAPAYVEERLRILAESPPRMRRSNG